MYGSAHAKLTNGFYMMLLSTGCHIARWARSDDGEMISARKQKSIHQHPEHQVIRACHAWKQWHLPMSQLYHRHWCTSFFDCTPMTVFSHPEYDNEVKNLKNEKTTGGFEVLCFLQVLARLRGSMNHLCQISYHIYTDWYTQWHQCVFAQVLLQASSVKSEKTRVLVETSILFFCWWSTFTSTPHNH